MNPSVPQTFIDQAYEDDAIAASAEFGGQFRTDVAVLFDRDAIRAVTISGRLELPPAAAVVERDPGHHEGTRHRRLTRPCLPHDPQEKNSVSDPKEGL